jgi:ribosomal protein S18 acetylase RimI-like enzyme
MLVRLPAAEGAQTRGYGCGMPVTIRAAGPDDYDTVARLWRDFVAEIPPPSYETLDVDKELGEIRDILETEVAFLAEDDVGSPVGFALGRARARSGTLTDVYVAPGARRDGIARQLALEMIRAFAARGLEQLDLDVQISNSVARSVYARWGLRDEVVVMTAPLAELERRLGGSGSPGSFGSVHVQTDDVAPVEQAVRQFVPRLPGASRGSIVAPPRNGWTGVYDDVCDRDPALLQRLARELSDRRGAVVVLLGVEQGAVLRMIVFERGSIVDEYLSVPEYYGPLAPGDVVGLAANPRVIARLTGADPAAVRAIARTAAAPADLPPARELLEELAREIGIEGAGHGWADAPEIPGAIRIERA